MTYNDITRNEKTLSGALALVMHLLFFALLVFGITWQKRQSESAVVVDLWNNLPPIPQPKAEVQPKPVPPRVEPKPEPPKPVPPKVEPKPVPKPETKPVPKPDIALKEKLEKERKQKEQARIEQQREEEKKRLAALKEKQAKEAAEAKRLAALKEQQEALKRMQAQQAAAQARLINEYTERIKAKIRRYIVEPPNLQGNPEAQFDVVLLPGGEVLSVKLKKSSAVAAYDNAVERAILRAQPLPLPPDPALFQSFRELDLKFRPKD